MGSFRLEKVGHLIRELVSEVIRELKDPRIGFAGINEVKISPDLRHAKIYISVFGSDKEKNDTLEGLNSAKGYIKRKIAPELSLRQIPDLSFALDESIENGVRISQLIDKARAEDKKLALSAGRTEEDTEEEEIEE
ncbi:30S ribosome-binding factor RbfA [bacterium]|nr:30S ribosome-binding factor RbfA [bacterium]